MTFRLHHSNIWQMKTSLKTPDFNSRITGRRGFMKKTLIAGLGVGLIHEQVLGKTDFPKPIRVGIIGLSVHSADFTEILNSQKNEDEFMGCRVVAIYHPPGNEDVEFSPERLEKFSNTIKQHGVEFLESIDAVLKKSDAVMLLTNDGRPHLEQLLPILKSGKPVYIDKPLAENLSQVHAIFEASGQHGVPVFSSSALRYGDIQKIRMGKVVGQVLGADAYSPAPLQASHVDLFWDGIHGVEILYTVMGTGCKSVTCTHHTDADVVVGTWSDGRIGVFRGLRKGKLGFGGTVYGSDGIAAIGSFSGYQPLVAAIAEFFRTGQVPVERDETIEIYTFMAAAEESRRRGGIIIDLSEVLAKVLVDT